MMLVDVRCTMALSGLRVSAVAAEAGRLELMLGAGGLSRGSPSERPPSKERHRTRATGFSEAPAAAPAAGAAASLPAAAVAPLESPADVGKHGARSGCHEV
jgi:hypothetical protein